VVLDGARADIGFLDGLRSSLDRSRQDLVRLRDAVAALPGGTGGDAEEASALAAYTMESEREIHRAVTSGAAVPAVAAVAPAGAAAELGDNIELF
jgi:hypothetical protein